LGQLVAAAIAGRLVTRLGPGTTAVIGLVMMTTAQQLVRFLIDGGRLDLIIIALLVLNSAAFVEVTVPLTIVGSTGGSQDDRGAAAGLAIQVGNPIGLAVVSASNRSTALGLTTTCWRFALGNARMHGFVLATLAPVLTAVRPASRQ